MCSALPAARRQHGPPAQPQLRPQLLQVRNGACLRASDAQCFGGDLRPASHARPPHIPCPPHTLHKPATRPRSRAPLRSRTITLRDPTSGATRDHIIICAKRDIAAWEELVYDYRFSGDQVSSRGDYTASWVDL